MHNLVSEEVAEKIEGLISNATAENPDFEYEFSFINPNNTFKRIHLNAHAMIENNEIHSLFFIVKDVTEEYEQKKELDMLYDTLQDVEDSNKFSIPYMNNKGEYHGLKVFMKFLKETHFLKTNINTFF